jgi:hypothetical protein
VSTAPGELTVALATAAGRIIVTDSVTFCDDRVGPSDVVVAGSFAGATALGFVLERGVRAVIAHEAGVGRDAAGISGLPLADRLGIPAAAVATMSARIGDGASLMDDGVINHVNPTAAALGVKPGLAARDAARLMLAAPPGRPGGPLLDRVPRVVVATDHGRMVLTGSMSFCDARYRGDVLCAGSHGGRVNVRPVLAIRPRGALFNDGGMARERSGVNGLPALDTAGIAAAAVAAESARIGDPDSMWATGVLSAVNDAARARGVQVGQTVQQAARLLLAP